MNKMTNWLYSTYIPNNGEKFALNHLYSIWISTSKTGNKKNVVEKWQKTKPRIKKFFRPGLAKISANELSSALWPKKRVKTRVAAASSS